MFPLTDTAGAKGCGAYHWHGIKRRRPELKKPSTDMQADHNWKDNRVCAMTTPISP